MNAPPDAGEERVSEVEDLIEHLQRYRATTLQVFELVDDGELAWRPAPDQYSLGQQLLHIAQAEDRFLGDRPDHAARERLGGF